MYIILLLNNYFVSQIEIIYLQYIWDLYRPAKEKRKIFEREFFWVDEKLTATQKSDFRQIRQIISFEYFAIVHYIIAYSSSSLIHPSTSSHRVVSE